VQAIVVAPGHPEALNEAIARHEAAGLKVVVIDSPLLNAQSSAYVGTDQYAAGVAAGKLMASLIGPTDDVCLFRHNQNGSATAQREAGVVAALREARPEVAIRGDIYSSTVPGEEPARARVLLDRHPDARAVLASGTPGTMAMLATLADSPRAGHIHFIGFGFNLNPPVVKALETGVMHGWIAQIPEEVGAGGMRTALALLNGQAVPATTHIPFRIITKDNLRDPEVQRLLMP
jgi:ribose transport system substrate-binding protein